MNREQRRKERKREQPVSRKLLTPAMLHRWIDEGLVHRAHIRPNGELVVVLRRRPQALVAPAPEPAAPEAVA
jgi:hypothetical protein